MNQSASLDQLIGAVSDKLTRTDRRIAALILEDPTRLAFGTVADLAAQADTSGPSIVRFAAKLGFDGFSDLQNHTRQSLSARLARPTDRLRGNTPDASTDLLTLARGHALDSIESVLRAFGDGQLEPMARVIAEADSIFIVSGEIGLAAANILGTALGMIRPRVRLVDESTLDVRLASAGPGDAAIVLTFLRYKRASVETAMLMHDRGMSIVSITDGPLSPVVAISERWISVVAPAVGPFDSSIAAVMAAELLVAEVARQLQDQAVERLDSIEALWLSTNHFHSGETES